MLYLLVDIPLDFYAHKIQSSEIIQEKKTRQKKVKFFRA